VPVCFVLKTRYICFVNLILNFKAMIQFCSRLVCFVLLFVAAGVAGAQAQTKPSASMLCGTSSKVWKPLGVSAAGEEERLRFFAGGTYSMSGAGGTTSGKYTFSQTRNILTIIPEGASEGSAFAVEALTESKLTLKGDGGATMMLEAE
jgi:hypothetical protein